MIVLSLQFIELILESLDLVIVLDNDLILVTKLLFKLVLVLHLLLQDVYRLLELLVLVKYDVGVRFDLFQVDDVLLEDLVLLTNICKLLYDYILSFILLSHILSNALHTSFKKHEELFPVLLVCFGLVFEPFLIGQKVLNDIVKKFLRAILPVAFYLL